MSQNTAHLVTARTLIRVALTILSLSGMAHAQSASIAPQQSGNNYNFLAGGGG